MMVKQQNRTSIRLTHKSDKSSNNVTKRYFPQYAYSNIRSTSKELSNGRSSRYPRNDQIIANTVLPEKTLTLFTPDYLLKLIEGEVEHEANQKSESQVAEAKLRTTPRNGSDTQVEPFADNTLEGPYQEALPSFGQWLYCERKKRGWTQGELANKLSKPMTAIRRWEYNQASPDIRSRQRLASLFERDAPSLQRAEKSITRFLKRLLKAFVAGVISTILFPFLGHAIAATAAITTLTVTSIQNDLDPLDIHLQKDTITKLAKPLQGKQFDESDLRKVIEELLSKDKQVNEDLANAFRALIPTLQKAARPTNIEISGPVQGFIAGDNNTITQTFSGFLQQR